MLRLRQELAVVVPILAIRHLAIAPGADHISCMTNEGSKNPTQRSIERWEGEGGATRRGPQTSSNRKRSDDTSQSAKEAKRRLGAGERRKIAEDRRLKEIAAHPDKMIAVQVQDATDERRELPPPLGKSM